MTTIIAVQHEDHCEFISDSLVTADGDSYTHIDFKKVTDTGKYLIGVAGHLKALQFIEHSWTPPNPTAKDKKDLFKFVVTKVSPSIRSAITTSGLFSDKEKEKDEATYNILIAVNGTIFEIDDDLCVAQRDRGVYGIGSGSPYALGALSAGATLDRAIEIASHHDRNTGGPFVRHTQYKS